MQSSAGLRLNALPVELQEKILVFTSFSTILNITLVNRALHSVCETKAVYRGLIDNRNGHGGPRWKTSMLLQDHNLHAWKRLARADDCASGNFHVREAEAMQWLAQLIATGHPAVDRVEPSNPDLLGWTSQSQPFEYAQSFCLAVASMKNTPNYQAELGDESALAERRSTFTSSFGVHISFLDFESFTNLCLDATPHSNSAYEALEQFYPALRRTVKNGLPTATWDGRRRRMVAPYYKLPKKPIVTNIPFETFMQIPSPFEDGAIESFNRCHLPVMTSKAFLEDGDWIGCYTVERLHPTFEMHFDPPVHSIKFQVGDKHPEKPLLYFTGEGKDSINIFNLKGAINTETGLIAMVKSYGVNAYTSWNNIGIVTPFGIMTAWGDEEWGGWALIWKTSWCSDDDGDEIKTGKAQS